MNVYIQCFDLERPLSWQAFNRLPVNKQIEYLHYLKDELGATNKMIGDMWAVHANTVQIRCRNLGLDYADRNTHPDPRRNRRWRAWLLQHTPQEIEVLNDHLVALLPDRKQVVWA